MKTVLIMGINGGFGSYVAQALVHQGWSIKALMRDSKKLPQQFQSAEVITGDVCNIEDIRKAAHGVDLMVYAVNPANYQWDGKVVPWLENATKVAEENKCTVVFPGNVYVFNPCDGPEFDENAPVHPISSRGELRQQMEDRLKLAAERGAQIIILRAGDFIAAGTKSSWIKALIKPSSKGVILSTPGPMNKVHTWAYLPDVAQTVAELVNKKNDLPHFNVFHFKGHRASFNDIAAAIQQATGEPVIVKRFPWWALRIFSPFNSAFKYLLEMRYLWNCELNLSNAKLQHIIKKPIPHTALTNALLETGLLDKPHV